VAALTRSPMSNTPRISVLLTSYNREDYIAESIQSVLAQSMADFELIICDDCSKDRTVDIANEYARRDSRIRVSINEHNLGDYGNRRQAATLARGRFLKYHDSDDVMYPHCLVTMVEPLEAEPRAAFAMSGPCSWPGGPCPMLLTPRLAYEREFLGLGLFQQGPASAMFRTEAFSALGGFPEVNYAGDYLFWLRACAAVNVLLVPGDLFYYRIHPRQEIANPASDFAYARTAGETWRMLNSPACPLSGEALKIGKRNFVFIQAREVYRKLKRKRYRSAVDVVRHCGLGSGDWISHLRRPCRNSAAGTPAAGDAPADRSQRLLSTRTMP
jgi:glycosyltransferase involved in cell wall biosynthesis